jgi:hypothetical protein
LNIKILAVALALAPASVSVAQALEIELSLTGPDPAYSFALPISPVVDSYDLGYSFTTAGYTFDSVANGGGFNQYFGVQIYGGPESSPTFQAGVYSLFNANTGNVDTLTLSVPELSTWTMMLVGFCGLGFAGYRRNKAAILAA